MLSSSSSAALQLTSSIYLITIGCLLLLSYCNVVQGGSKLEGLLKAGDDASKPYKLKFELRNLTPEKLMILKWNTPFEKNMLTNPIFKVINLKDASLSRNNYYGRLVRRTLSKLSKNDVLEIQPQQVLEADIDLSQAYGLDKGDNMISINFDIVLIRLSSSLEAKPLQIKATQVYPLSGELKITMNEKITPPEPVKSSSSVIRKAPSLIETLLSARNTKQSHRRQQQQQQQQQQRIYLAQQLRGNGVSIHENCQAHVDSVLQAAVRARELADNAHKYLSLDCTWDERYQKWFGADIASRRKKVKTIISAVRTNIANYSIQCSGSQCDSGDVAYVIPRLGREVYLCFPMFSDLPESDYSRFGTKGGSLLHELTHFEGTFDHVYEESPCLSMARTDPDKAIANADTYMYFAIEADFPSACPIPAAITPCAQGQQTYLSNPINDCESIYRGSYDSDTKLISTQDQNKYLQKRIAASTTTTTTQIGLFWDAQPQSIWPSSKQGVYVQVRGEVRPAKSHRCCIKACVKPSGWLGGAIGSSSNSGMTIEVYSRDADKNQCDVDASSGS